MSVTPLTQAPVRFYIAKAQMPRAAKNNLGTDWEDQNALEDDDEGMFFTYFALLGFISSLVL